MRTAKEILLECFLGVIDFNEEAAIDAMEKYADQFKADWQKDCKKSGGIIKNIFDGNGNKLI